MRAIPSKRRTPWTDPYDNDSHLARFKTFAPLNTGALSKVYPSCNERGNAPLALS